MMNNFWLRIVVMGLPVVVAWVTARLGERALARWLPALAADATAVLAAILFWQGGFGACTLAAGEGNCFWEGLMAGLTAVGGLALGLGYFRMAPPTGRLPLGLLLLGGLAGIGLAPNLLFWLAAWAVVLFTATRWSQERDLRWGFFEVRDVNRETFDEWDERGR